MKITTYKGPTERVREVSGKVWTLTEILGSRWDSEEIYGLRITEPVITGDLWSPGSTGTSVRVSYEPLKYLEGYVPETWELPEGYPVSWEIRGTHRKEGVIQVTPGAPEVLTIKLVCTEVSPIIVWDTIRVGICGSSHPGLSGIIEELVRRYNVPGLRGLVSRYGGGWNTILQNPGTLEGLVRMDRSLDCARMWLTGISGETHNGNTTLSSTGTDLLAWPDGVVIKF